MDLVGHRGDPRHAPENTLASLETAWRHGRRAVEFDVRASRDGVPILFHDATLDRVTSDAGPVANRAWERLQTLDVGSWFGRAFADERLVSLAQVLHAFRRRPITMFIELKVAGLERAVHRAIWEAGMVDRCRIASSHTAALVACRRLRPRLPLYRVTGYGQPITPRMVSWAGRVGLHGLLSFKRWVVPGLAARLRAANLELYVWTIRTAAEQARMRRLGVTGVMTEWCRR